MTKQSFPFQMNPKGKRATAAMIPALVAALLLPSAAARHAFAQSAPLVYDDENTGANYPKPVIPDYPLLPIMRPLPDPFAWFDGSPRDTSFAS